MECPHCGKVYKRQSAFDKHVNTHTSATEGDRKREACLKFQKDHTKNPYTGRAIKFNGIVYKKIDKECKDILLQFRKDTTDGVKPIKTVKPVKSTKSINSSKPVSKVAPRVSRFITKPVIRIGNQTTKPAIRPYTFDPTPYIKNILVNLGQSPRSYSVYLKEAMHNYQRLGVHVQQLPTHETTRSVYSLALVAIVTKFEFDVNNLPKDRVINDTILRIANQQGLTVSKTQLIHAERELFERIMSLKL